MENLPFLSKSEPLPPRPQSVQLENEWDRQRLQELHDDRFQQPKKDPFEMLKTANPIALILLGIVIGTLIVSMRPIVVQAR
jgi:hypothetical protein